MKFNEKLQKLRKQKGITQEELAQALYVSRAAVSKWESGRGYPGIDSLKAIGEFFGVTVDELLSGNELLCAAQEDSRRKENHIRDLVFGLLDCSIAMYFFLPFFRQKENGVILASALVTLDGISSWLKTAYYILVIGAVIAGILLLALQNCTRAFWSRNKSKVSLLINALGAILFVICLQPYAAAYLLMILAIKVLMLIKWQ